jgi:hypothetical protein
MICPKCEEGAVNKIVFKENGKRGSLCDFCDAWWFEGETIGIMSNHTLSSFSKREDLEYTIEEIDEKDQEHRPIRKIK